MGEPKKKSARGQVIPLRGIWTLGAKDLAAECEWLYRIGDVLVRGVSDLLGGVSVSVPRVPRRSGNHSFGYYLVADIAQCLRYARNESTMTADYAEEVANTVATILGTRAIDLVDLGGFELRTVVLPVPAIEWEGLVHHTVARIIMATRARRLLESGKPLPLPLATALTGWTEDELTKFVDDETSQKMAHKKSKGIRYFEAPTFDLALQSIEKIFFDHQTYKPL